MTESPTSFVEHDIADIAKSLGAMVDRFDALACLSDIAEVLTEVSSTLLSIDKHLVEIVDRDQT